ncbi:hypothetical protein CEXT_302501 [Caerostris extrusa]|uniref:Uncharacterized protein n=1 Tax=Caerostris extrusa TaxID=172846 RepID=A0AAV4MBT3_CAEEX|nr:hypothetical protein CEXT_302501 [Caerostris extrusa]
MRESNIQQRDIYTERHQHRETSEHAEWLSLHQIQLNSNMKFSHVTNDAGIIGERLREQGKPSNSLVQFLHGCIKAGSRLTAQQWRVGKTISFSVLLLFVDLKETRKDLRGGFQKILFL